MTSGWPSLPSGSGLASLRIAPGNRDRPEASFHPVFTPVAPRILNLRPYQLGLTRVLPRQRAVGSIPVARSRYDFSPAEPSGSGAFSAVRGPSPIWRLPQGRFQMRLEAISCIGRWSSRTYVLMIGPQVRVECGLGLRFGSCLQSGIE